MQHIYKRNPTSSWALLSSNIETVPLQHLPEICFMFFTPWCGQCSFLIQFTYGMPLSIASCNLDWHSKNIFIEPELYLLKISSVKIIRHKYPLFLFIFWWNYFAVCSWKYCVAGIGLSSISPSSGDAVVSGCCTDSAVSYCLLKSSLCQCPEALVETSVALVSYQFRAVLSPPFLMLCHLLQEHLRNVLHGLPLLPHPSLPFLLASPSAPLPDFHFCCFTFSSV